MHKILILLMALQTTLLAAAEGKPVRYESGGQTYEGYYVAPREGAPLVFILHDWDGLTEYEILRANLLAEQGYAVFAADLFGAGIRPTEDKDRRQHTGELYTDRAKMRRLMFAALATAASLGADRTNAVAMGYCFGGAAALELARSGADLKGFVSFHGGLGTPEGQDYRQAKGEILVFHGSADTAISLEDLRRLTAELEEQKVPHEVISYGGAPHAFTVIGSPRYQKTADERSWKRFLDFLAEKLTPSAP